LLKHGFTNDTSNSIDDNRKVNCASLPYAVAHG
jgi:hypothetical protein